MQPLLSLSLCLFFLFFSKCQLLTRSIHPTAWLQTEKYLRELLSGARLLFARVARRLLCFRVTEHQMGIVCLSMPPSMSAHSAARLLAV